MRNEGFYAIAPTERKSGGFEHNTLRLRFWQFGRLTTASQCIASSCKVSTKISSWFGSVWLQPARASKLQSWQFCSILLIRQVLTNLFIDLVVWASVRHNILGLCAKYNMIEPLGIQASNLTDSFNMPKGRFFYIETLQMCPREETAAIWQGDQWRMW